MGKEVSESALDSAISPVSAARRIENKGRKGKAVPDASWDDVLRESLENVGVNPPKGIKQVEEPTEPIAEMEPPNGPDLENGLPVGDEPNFEDMIEEIKKMANEPEKLVESHLGVFIEPVQPGKWVNSQG